MRIEKTHAPWSLRADECYCNFYVPMLPLILPKEENMNETQEEKRKRLQACREWWENYCHSGEGEWALGTMLLAGIVLSIFTMSAMVCALFMG